MCKNSTSEYTEEEQQKIYELRELVEECKELDIGTEDIFLTKFLCCTDWDVEKAFKRIQHYYDFKHHHPDWTAKRLPADFKAIMALKTKYVLPFPDKQGRTVYVHRLVDGFSQFKNYFFDLVEFDDLIFEAVLSMPSTQKNGVSVILDMKGLSRSFLKHMGPKTVRVANKKNDVLPFRETHFHVVNTSFFMSTALSMVLPFLGKAMKDKMYFHGNNLGKLADHIGYESLPPEYGGPKENALDVNTMYDFLWERQDYLKKLQSYRKITI